MCLQLVAFGSEWTVVNSRVSAFAHESRAGANVMTADYLIFEQ